MSLTTLPKMLFSDSKGWQDLLRRHPSTRNLFLMYVVPMSVIPPAMFLHAMVGHQGQIFPALQPPLAPVEAFAVGVAFFLAELAMVRLMASLIQQMGDVIELRPDPAQSLTLAAVAPTPLWLAPLALFVPSLWFNAAVFALAWFASAALIFHGVSPLFGIENKDRARTMASFVLAAGVVAWLALMVVLVLLLSMILGWR